MQHELAGIVCGAEIVLMPEVQSTVDEVAAQYLDLLSSYSGHRALTTQARDGLYECIGALIGAAGGAITKRYLNQLSVGISLNQPLA